MPKGSVKIVECTYLLVVMPVLNVDSNKLGNVAHVTKIPMFMANIVESAERANKLPVSKGAAILASFRIFGRLGRVLSGKL